MFAGKSIFIQLVEPEVNHLGANGDGDTHKSAGIFQIFVVIEVYLQICLGRKSS